MHASGASSSRRKRLRLNPQTTWEYNEAGSPIDAEFGGAPVEAWTTPMRTCFAVVPHRREVPWAVWVNPPSRVLEALRSLDRDGYRATWIATFTTTIVPQTTKGMCCPRRAHGHKGIDAFASILQECGDFFTSARPIHS
uniref:Uncharacterized protein n=1 Tax=Cannabis sativa TaxID=3483 RepID=A0A803QBF5_CANSA